MALPNNHHRKKTDQFDSEERRNRAVSFRSEYERENKAPLSDLASAMPAILIAVPFAIIFILAVLGVIR